MYKNVNSLKSHQSQDCGKQKNFKCKLCTFACKHKLSLKILEEIKQVKAQIKALSKDGRPYHEHLGGLKSKLPLRNVEEIKKFDEFLQESENNVEAFKNFVNYFIIYGPRQSVTEIYKKLFTNQLVMQCSWLGQDNSFRVCDNYSIFIIREIILKTFNLHEKIFEIISSEWFQCAKQQFKK